MRIWLEATLAKLSPKSGTAAAVRYALSRWRALTRYVDDGQLEIDNNAAERALRVVALGRKNFLFAGSDVEGERAAATTRCSDQPSSTGLTRRSISSASSNASPIIPSAGSANCSLGTSRSKCRPYPHSVCIHRKLCGYIVATAPHKNGPDHTPSPFSFGMACKEFRHHGLVVLTQRAIP